MAQPATFSLQRKSFFLLLVLALLWAQSLGLAHRMVHLPYATQGSAVLSGQATPLQPAHESRFELTRSHSGQAGLLAHFQTEPAQHSAQCQLLDQLAQGESPPCLGLLVPYLPSIHFNPPTASTTFWQIFLAVYAARAPPLVL
jgi:hypothetical protein